MPLSTSPPAWCHFIASVLVFVFFNIFFFLIVTPVDSFFFLLLFAFLFVIFSFVYFFRYFSFVPFSFLFFRINFSLFISMQLSLLYRFLPRSFMMSYHSHLSPHAHSGRWLTVRVQPVLLQADGSSLTRAIEPLVGC